MENLEQQLQIINLGRLFVQELKLEPGVDTFSRWMAHYIAEKMTIVECSEGNIKKEAEKQCFDTILKLWQHRQSIPSGKRPLENFEPIFEALSKLNPEKEQPYFYLPHNNREKKEPSAADLDDKAEVEKWMGIVEAVDKIARIWIEYALSRAASKAKDEKTKAWIEAATKLPDSADVDIIDTLLDEIPLFDYEEDKDELSKRYDIERLKKRISELSKFNELNSILLTEYQNELDKLEEKD
ncbi:hypothetical protein [Flavobacterium johnsoniae]|uniref:Uncharacterized protein n=1 Tax=Flavobacterium johnsoniae (strain ATCC 17061 / DSM 2064 / JCM 8514 / BCRC 14874 / CCUG 350202 / NBRC 14942 / NCIMB 11054 / UW101) TaxID=376686 RepID=A5FE15_FLAJ1|nr:hypothetical protein [Flavobacterium johnsoniae]ABQ06548.1 hypothetical protein Fjoh_3534 [Flavobacterium johnsoniae UW101]OXE99786.1 hypothetical protein B0A63_10805 [Flavobacterium johnsoniae UW101]WQG82300.1 hypothetical protein SR927_04105 [Flavobacterium johnsoniae UW101]SHK79089.1 hypothetical protein SAMN05444146_2284 [Flavobacterium johnsoniae]